MLETTVHKPPMKALSRPGHNKTTCRECGVDFLCTNETQLCDACTPNRADDLFTRPPRSARRPAAAPAPAPRLVGRATCAVCGLRAEALICKECTELPDARGMVERSLAGVVAQLDRITADWLAFAAERADSWERLRQAQSRPDYAERCKAHRAAGNVYGQLLERHEAMELAVQPLAIEQARLEQALWILETL